MERIITKQVETNAAGIKSYQANALKHNKKIYKREELCCSQLLKNLKNTNLGLLKINDISTILLF